jgi:Mechanosensitive ion channel
MEVSHNFEVESTASSIQHDPVLLNSTDDIDKSSDIPIFKSFLSKMIGLVISIILAAVLYYVMIDGQSAQDNKLFYIISYVVVSFIFSLFVLLATSIILDIVLLKFNKAKEKSLFAIKLIKQFEARISLFVACFTTSIVITLLKTTHAPAITENLIQNEIEDLSKKASNKVSIADFKEFMGDIAQRGFFNILEEIFDTKLSQVYHAIGKLIVTIMIKDIAVFVLNYNVYIQNFYDRVKQNTEKINLLRLLNDIVGAPYTDDIKAVCKSLIEKIGNENSQITFSGLCKFMSAGHARKILNFCDSVGDMIINYDELVYFYKNTLSEQKYLSEGLGQKNTTVKSLAFVLNFLFLPMAFYICITTIFSDGTEKSGFFILSAIASGGFAFSDSIKTFLGAVTFVFLLRDFEVGDIIVIKDKVYQVSQVNLITTILTEDNVHVTFDNSKFLGAEVKNLRLTKSKVKSYKFQFKIDEFEELKDRFIENVNAYIKNHLTVFKNKKAQYNGYQIANKTAINVSLEVEFNYLYQEIPKVLKREEKFALDLNRILAETGFTSYESK